MKVSVIIPAYNASKYITQAIESCLIQKEVGQVIVVDDASTDDTLLKVQLIKDDRILLVIKLKNEGASAARNEGFRYIKCDYFTFLDADDYYEIDRFRLPLRMLSQDAALSATYETVENFYEEGSDHFRTDLGKFIDFHPSGRYDSIFDEIITDKVPFFSIISLVLRTELLRDLKFDTSYRTVEDNEFIYHLTRKYKVKKCEQNEVKIKRRLHLTNTTRVGAMTINTSAQKVLDKWFDMTLVEKFTPSQTRTFFYRKLSTEYVNRYGVKGLIHRIGYKSIIGLRLLVKYPMLISRLIRG